MRQVRWLIGGVVIVVCAAIAFGVWFVFGGNTPAKPNLTRTASTLAGGPATPVGTWKITPGKDVYVGYRITEVFKGDVIHKTAVGRTPAVSGTMSIVGNSVTVTGVTAEMQQLESDRAPRDNYIHTHAIESDTYTTSVFTLTRPITLSTKLTKGVTQHLHATGTLTLHGVTRTIQVPLDAVWTGPTIQVDASDIPIVLSDYKITPPDTGVTKVDDHGSLEFSLSFTPTS